MFTTVYCRVGRQYKPSSSSGLFGVLSRPCGREVKTPAGAGPGRQRGHPGAISWERFGSRSSRFGEAELVAATSARKRITWGRDGFVGSFKVRECSTRGRRKKARRRLCASCSPLLFTYRFQRRKKILGCLTYSSLVPKLVVNLLSVIELSFVFLLSSGSQNTTGAVALVIGNLCVSKCGKCQRKFGDRSVVFF
jgi:hypothetical protein